MKILVAYDSKHGNTRKIAEEIASAFGPEHQVQFKSVAEATPGDVVEDEVLVIGCPTHAWSPTAWTKNFLDSLQGASYQGKYGAAFDTKFSLPLTGSAARTIEKRLADLGFQIAAPHFSAIVRGMKGPLNEGQLEKGREFAAAILNGIETNPEH
jgi:flavodoxin